MVIFKKTNLKIINKNNYEKLLLNMFFEKKEGQKIYDIFCPKKTYII